MLARLEEEDGTDAAEVDRRGELIRLTIQDFAQVPKILDLLLAIGFAAEVVEEDRVGDRRWYPRAAVGELSREEGQVIARRVVPGFARVHGLSAEEGSELARLVSGALHECFVAIALDANAPTGSLHGPCASAVARATTERIGSVLADELGSAVAADLAARSTA